MANRTWRNELNNSNYLYGNSFNAAMRYNQNFYDDRRDYSNRGSYHEDIRRDKRTYDSIALSPKKDGRENSQYGFYRNNNATPPIVQNKSAAKYSVKSPKVTLDLKGGSIAILRSRYPKLYVPSDFFHSDLRWQDVFPLYSPLNLGNATKFQMFHGDVEPLQAYDNERLNPSDASYTYSAKVMILESMDMSTLIKSVCDASASGKKTIYKSLKFLVGSKSKNEPLAIGGAWSPSLDGLNPDEDPQVLINTAIRTCKELTAIDLTPCKDWYRFVEYHYYRPVDRQGLDISNEDKNQPKTENNLRVETVVIFVPSVWDCMPDENSWEDIKTRYSVALEAILTPQSTVEIMDSGDKKDDTIEIAGETLGDQIDWTKDVDKLDNYDDKIEIVEKKENDQLNKVKELTEKDKKRLEQLYKMNDSSSIVVHVNKSAKGGKFQCQFMSLESLFEYRSDDQKEHTFEVSLFAEQFCEMIQRDAAFNIYKTLIKLPKQVEINNEPDSKRRRQEIDLTVSKIESDILLSFCVFDFDHSGYIKDHDLEDIIQSIGLVISKSQVRTIINKVTNHKNDVHYRELSIQDGDAEVTVTDMELSKGNRSMIVTTNDDHQHTIYLDTASSTDEKMSVIDAHIKDIVDIFNKTKSELENERIIYHQHKDTENALRSQLKDLDVQLYGVRKSVRECTQTQDVYNGLLRMARDVMDRAKLKIDRQFEKETQSKDAERDDGDVAPIIVNDN